MRGHARGRPRIGEISHSRLCPLLATNDIMKAQEAIFLTQTPLSDDSSFSYRVEIWPALAVNKKRIAQS